LSLYETNNIAVDVDNVTKHYEEVTALKKVSLSIRDNEFFTLLGPSGCGKTTLLRTIAGFEGISEGDIRLFGDSIVDLPPNKRPVNTVFQQYALFPHMTVMENVAFGLRRQKVADSEARKRTGEVLELVQLSGYADRLPSQLSGGQQQRVALARALAPRPKVLLLDEPLSALDLKLRQDVRVELQQIQHNTGITFVFVTHDQEEALTMSNRIAVMCDGVVLQVGTSRDIYESPENKFVADFIGDTNLIDVEVVETDGSQATCLLPGNVKLVCSNAKGAAKGKASLSVRPERLSLVDASNSSLSGTVSRLTYLGTDIHVAVTLEDGEVIDVRVQNSEDASIPEPGAIVGLNLKLDAARVLMN
jgi:spermidine/putrescine transport system ATP-binding protein